MFEHSEQDAATNCSLHRTETLIRTCSCDIHTYNYTTLFKCARYKAKDRQEHIHLTFKSFQMRLPYMIDKSSRSQEYGRKCMAG